MHQPEIAAPAGLDRFEQSKIPHVRLTGSRSEWICPERRQPERHTQHWRLSCPIEKKVRPMPPWERGGDIAHHLRPIKHASTKSHVSRNVDHYNGRSSANAVKDCLSQFDRSWCCRTVFPFSDASGFRSSPTSMNATLASAQYKASGSIEIFGFPPRNSVGRLA